MNTTTQGDASGWRVGVVSYLNSKPLIYGLEHDSRVSLTFDVPARLPALLDRGAVDAALVPIVDLLAPGRRWHVVSDACIASDGETLTVRVFSHVPAGDVRRIFVDGDSHTSVILAQIIWRELYGVSPQIIPLHTATPGSTGGPSTDHDSTDDTRPPSADIAGPERDTDAVLLIGDKVVTSKPAAFDVQTDLGAAWKTLTGLPFVFAVWAAREGTPTAGLAELLERARDAGVRGAHLIAEDVGPGMGWPVAAARRYLTARLRFTLLPRYREGMARFLDLARKHDLVPPERELVFA